ncbi:MAG: ABC transporter permease [Campylobacter sp.]|nr:ABC transporter permease [Campylobacter sp.]
MEKNLSEFFINLSLQNGTQVLKFGGELSYKNAKILNHNLQKIKWSRKKIVFDFTQLKRIDYAVAVVLQKFISHKKVSVKNQNDKIKAIFSMVNDDKINLNYKIQSEKANLLARLGKKIVEGFSNVFVFSNFIGEFLVKIFNLFKNPLKMRFRELSNYIKDVGVNAIFIVSLTAFLIGIVLAYLGSSMLQNFGASIFIVEIMGILTLREVAPLITAIVIAGRSASSFTAQIGAMKLSEEIDAMKTMGFDPFYFLVLPRVIAMMLCVPLVIFIADAVSVFGQMLVCENLLDITFSSYLSRFREMVELRHFAVGMIKAPFFGAVIAMIGCMRGFEVSQDSQRLGSLTTLSVVNAIFWVIALDAFFAIAFMWMKI